eukprot:snap_masked-scaffold_5-processed-gene-11.19-mRNA-1 protein AED:1.00 eAED:1.00 QI:0/-1/0/0/-1/1/1/0/81
MIFPYPGLPLEIRFHDSRVLIIPHFEANNKFYSILFPTESCSLERKTEFQKGNAVLRKEPTRLWGNNLTLIQAQDKINLFM